MKKSLIKLSMTAFILSNSSGAYAQFSGYLQGLRSDLQISETKLEDKLNQNIAVKKMNFWDRFTSPTATALYSPLFNTIKLKKELLQPNGKIKDARKIRGERYLTTPVVTIFHEMGHAEIDTLIENGVSPEALSLMNLYRQRLKKKYATTFKGINPYDIFHEHYAYYKTAVLEFMYNELANIYMANGYNYIQKRCYLAPLVKKLLKDGAPLEEFIKLHALSSKRFYRQEIEVRYVFVKGESYELEKIPGWDSLKNFVHLNFWSSVQKHYGFPVNRSDFVRRLNENGELNDLRACREKLYEQYHKSND